MKYQPNSDTTIHIQHWTESRRYVAHRIAEISATWWNRYFQRVYWAIVTEPTDSPTHTLTVYLKCVDDVAVNEGSGDEKEIETTAFWFTRIRATIQPTCGTQMTRSKRKYFVYKKDWVGSCFVHRWRSSASGNFNNGCIAFVAMLGSREFGNVIKPVHEHSQTEDIIHVGHLYRLHDVLRRFLVVKLTCSPIVSPWCTYASDRNV